MFVVMGDGHVVFAELLGSVLRKRGWEVGAPASTPAAVVEAVERLRPELCLVDEDSLHARSDLIGSLVSRGGGRTKVVALSSDPSLERAARSLRSGASGFATKRGGVDDLLAVVDRVVVGERAVERADRSRRRRCAQDAAALAMAAYLTVRERECLALLVDGASTSRMALELDVSTLTVRSHIRSVLAKLGVHSRLEAATLAVRHGLLEGVEPAPAARSTVHVG